MSSQGSVWIVIALALVSANIPFVSERWGGLIAVKGRKGLGARLLELGFFYVLTGLVGLVLERRLGQIAPQGWEFYAITAAFFVTMAFPGFVVRYLWVRRRTQPEG